MSVTLLGHMERPAPELVITLSDAEKEEMRARMRERDRLRQLRDQAILNLWRQAVSEIEVRHPDCRVTVNANVYSSWSGGITISFLMKNLRDTGNPDQIFPYGFRHEARPHDWPGYACAKTYLAGSWVLALMHETMELVTHRGTAMQYRTGTLAGVTGKPVVDPHDNYGFNQRLLRDDSVVEIMALVVGRDKAVAIRDRDRDRADRDIAAEIDFIDGKIPTWQ